MASVSAEQQGMLQQSVPLPTTMSHRGTVWGCAVTALPHCRHRHDLIHCGKQPPLMASFQCFPPVWLPVWGGVHTSGRSLLSSLSKSGGFLCLVREQRGWAPCEALRAAPVEDQRSSTETQCSVLQNATHTLLCCVFSRHPRFVSFLTSPTVSLSYLNVKKHFSKYRCYLCHFLTLKCYLGDQLIACLLKCIFSILKLLPEILSVLHSVPCDTEPD